VNGLQSVVRQLSPIQRIWIGGAAVASAVLLFVFVSVAGAPNYQPAFTKLTAAEAGAVSSALRSAKIDFQLADAGATVLVPAASLAQARVAAGQAGVVTDGSTPGMELFDKTNFGMTSFDQQVTYQRAVEGELTRTIQSLDGVASARVTFVPEQVGVLSTADRPATASVVVAMKDQSQPDRAMVHGIVSSVASSVSGLSPDNVTVIDEYGHILAGPQAGDSNDALVAQATLEQSIEAKVKALVDQAIGPGHASVAVSATIDTAKVEQQITTYVPVTKDNWTPVSLHLTSEVLSGDGSNANGGIPGVNSNIPGLPTYPVGSAAPSAAPSASAGATPAASPGASPSASTAPSPTPSGYNKQDVTVNYNLSQKIEHIVQQPGVLQRLSVSVLVDQAASAGISTDKLQAAIAAAIGADAARGDVVSVTALAFATAAPVAAKDIISQVAGTAPQVIPTGLAIVAGLIMLLLLWRNLGTLGRRSEEAALLAAPPNQLADPGAGGAGAGYARESDATGRALLAAPAPDNSPQAQIQERLRQVAEDQPDAIVGLMHGWLREDGPRQ
jgi:flagellar M-ring protein FliF